MKTVKIRDHTIGKNHPVFIIAEIGINHNGDVDIAKKLIDVAKKTGCDAVKFQKRTPDLVVPDSQKNVQKETPWGVLSYLDYKKKIELGKEEYQEINEYCKKKEIMWFASCWDEQSVDFIDAFDPPCYKIASASLTDDELLKHTASKKKPMILSTGMSTLNEIEHAISILNTDDLVIMHCTSTYPSNLDELNLGVIAYLEEKYDVPIGYSGHEAGIFPTVAAVMLGAVAVERHITLDRAMYGTDQAASLEPEGLRRMVRDIRLIPTIIGDGVKKVYDSEKPIIEKLRRK